MKTMFTEKEIKEIAQAVAIKVASELIDAPTEEGTFTLKCIDGVLTWVEDEVE